jgi:hypothetical protein
METPGMTRFGFVHAGFGELSISAFCELRLHIAPLDCLPIRQLSVISIGMALAFTLPRKETHI